MNVGLVGAAWRRPRLAFPHGHAPARARHCSAGAAAKRSLEVDLELDATTVRREFFLEEEETSTLRVEFRASSERMLRVALSSFFDMSKVVIETLDEFEPTAK